MIKQEVRPKITRSYSPINPLPHNPEFDSFPHNPDFKPITKRQILDPSKLKEFEDDNFKFDKNGRKLSKPLKAISPFPTVFSKVFFPRGIKRCHCVGMGS